jgi:hypothetical protein
LGKKINRKDAKGAKFYKFSLCVLGVLAVQIFLFGSGWSGLGGIE